MLHDNLGTAASFPGKTNFYIYPQRGKVYPCLKHHPWPTEQWCTAMSPAINFTVYSDALESDRSLWTHTLRKIKQTEAYFNNLTLHTHPPFFFILIGTL